MASGNQTDRPQQGSTLPREDRIFQDGYEAGLRDADLRRRNGSGDCAEGLAADPKAYRGANPMPMQFGLSPIEHQQKRLEYLFSYHTPRPEQLPRYLAIRTAAKHFAEILMANMEPGKDYEAAIAKLRVVVMLANASVALDGRS